MDGLTWQQHMVERLMLKVKCVSCLTTRARTSYWQRWADGPLLASPRVGTTWGRWASPLARRLALSYRTYETCGKKEMNKAELLSHVKKTWSQRVQGWKGLSVCVHGPSADRNLLIALVHRTVNVCNHQALPPHTSLSVGYENERETLLFLFFYSVEMN